MAWPDHFDQNLPILLNLGTDTRESHLEAAYEAMRCVANALLLIDSGRDVWLDIQGGEACVEMLEVGSPCMPYITVPQLRLLTSDRHPHNLPFLHLESSFWSL